MPLKKRIMRKCFFPLIVIVTALCAACRKDADPSVVPPLLGWSSWNAYMVDISDSIIVRQGELMVSDGYLDAGYEYVNIDDGFMGFRDSGGNLTANPERFPEGMGPVVEKLHSMGLKAGIYSDAGHNTCGSTYNNDIMGTGAGLWQHEIQDIDLFFNRWKFDFIKIDWCGANTLGLDEPSRYARIGELIDSVSTRPVHFNICRWRYPGTWVSDVADSWRISGDIRPRWDYIKYIVEQNMYLSAYAGNGKYNDMDMLAVGYNIKPSPFWEDGLGLSYAEEEAHFGMWCIMSSPLLLGCDLAYIPEETRALVLNPELLALNQDPLGLQAYVAARSGDGYVFVKDIVKKRGNKRAVALYNPSDGPVHFVINPSDLEFKGAVKVRDLCRRIDYGTMDSPVFDVPAHNAVLLTFEGERIAEPSVYEAEWAYCNDFTGIEGKGGPEYSRLPEASLGAAVTGLGGSVDNTLSWKEIYSRRGGRYHMTLSFLGDVSGEVFVSINDAGPVRIEVPSGPQDIPFVANLRRGYNTLTLSNPEGPVPAVDRLVLKK